MSEGILVVKLGSTMPALAARRNDFEDWIIQGMGLTPRDVTVIAPPLGDPLPPPDHLTGVVLSGSHAMVTDHAPWSERTARWLCDVVDRETPVLGICYGHQLLAYAFGGQVAGTPLGREYGTVEATLTGEALSDPLLGGLGGTIKVQTSHTQSVLTLPEGTVLLAASARDPHLAFRIGPRAWGVQFHPEFDAEIVRAYIRESRAALCAEGQAPDALLAATTDTPAGPVILRRFAGLLKGSHT
jgi:GMP synthase (glutamine-hydrolysing)